VTFAIPHQSAAKLKQALSRSRAKTKANVSVTIDSFEPLPASRAYDDLIREAADAYRVDPKLIHSVIRAESEFNPWAVSRAGAQGLMQLMPKISRAFHITDPFDPRQNIMGGTRLLRELLDLHRGNVRLVLASYNAGAGVVARYGAVPPIHETQKYVKRVTDFLNND
jgi:soluble lytic murein transglycosylase-like protein